MKKLSLLCFLLLSIAAFAEVRSQARWLWCTESIVESCGKTRYFRKKIYLPSEPASGTIHAACDDGGAVYINGKCDNWRCGLGDPCSIPAVKALRKGENIIAFQGYNYIGHAGILLRGEITLKDGSKILIVTNGEWKCSKEKQEGWTALNFDDSKWMPATDLRGVNASHIWKNLLKNRKNFLSEKEFRDDANEATEVAEESKRFICEVNARLTPVPARKVSVVFEKGAPYFAIGNTKLPVFMYHAAKIPADQRDGRDRVRAFAKGGTHIYEMFAFLNEDNIWLDRNRFNPSAVVKRLYGILGSDPDAWVVIMIDITPPSWWLNPKPDEWVRYGSGKEPSSKADSLANAKAASFASLAWRKDAGEYVRKLIKEIEELPAGKRVLGYHFNYGVYSEWHSYGMMHDMPDTGVAMTKAFRRFLQEKYKTDAALEKAWGKKGVKIASAMPPAAAERKRASIISLHDSVKERAVLDFELCNQKELDDAQSHFVNVVKQTTQGRKLAGFYSGYLFGMGFPTTGWQINTPEKLAQKAVDYHSSPYCYGNRRLIGWAGLARAPIEAYAKYGVLSIMEADTRPHQVKAGKPKGAKCCYSDNFQEDVALLTRDFCQSYTRGGGIWYYDFGKGWYDAPQYQNLFKKFHQVQAKKPDCTRVSEVAMICDYHSMPYMNYADDGCDIGAWSVNCQAEELFKTGTPFDVLVTEQLLDGTAGDYKVYFFANQLRSNPAIVQKVKELRSKGKCIIWLYAPGFMCEKTGANLQNIERLTGFKAGILPERYKQGYQITNRKVGLLAPVLGTQCRSSIDGPVFYIADPQATTWGEWTYNGKKYPVLGAKRFVKSLNVYSTAPMLDSNLLRLIFKNAGVHIYSEDKADVVYVAKELVCIHTAKGGRKTIKLPAKAKQIIQVLPEEKKIATDTASFQVTVPAESTTLFQILWK